MPRTSWNEFGQMLSFMDRLLPKKKDPMEEAQAMANLESTALDIAGKRRALAGPSPSQKYQEEQRSQQVGSALAMFADLYKTASPSSKKILGEQMGSLWGIMAPGDKTKFKMLVSHTPLNPRVQKAMWFEETNPRPQMPIVKEGNGSFTNNPPRTPEYRRLWAEFDIASDEWNTLREMAVEGKEPKEKGWKNVPKFYDSDENNVKYYRDPIDRRIKEFNFANVDQAAMATAIEKGWATASDIMRTGSLPISAPRDYVENGRTLTVTPKQDLVRGGNKLQYDYAGPVDESKMEPPKELTEAIHLVDSGLSASDLKIKAPAVVGFYSQLKEIIVTSGPERLARQLDLQQSIVNQYPSEKRYIPFVPKDNSEGFWFRFQRALSENPLIGFVIPAPSEGKQGNVLLVQADRLVPFSDKKGQEKYFWWSDIYKIAYDIDGVPINESRGRSPGETLDIDWSQ
uniref:Uncharacterized protein n=1 Tax=viral metagenome TaxID=1070528 RepID=A0A6H1ZBK3_9ZZZZ